MQKPPIEIQPMRSVTISECQGGLWAISEDDGPAQFAATATTALEMMARLIGLPVAAEEPKRVRKPRSDRGVKRAAE